MKIIKIILPVLTMSVFLLLLIPANGISQSKQFTFGGYGVLHYNDEVRNKIAGTTPGEFDLHQIALKSAFHFDDRLTISSQLKIEHLFSGSDKGELIFMDQAYIDYKVQPDFGLRAGLYTVPMGGSRFNPSFGVEIAPTDKYIYYSWRELAAGVYGTFLNKVNYEAYVMSGLHVDELSTYTGVFSACKSPLSSSIDNLAVAARASYWLSSELKLGTSAIISDLQSKQDFGGRLKGANFKLIEGHAVLAYRGFNGRLVGVYSSISKTEKINAETGGNLGSSQYGALAEFGYDLFRLRKSPVSQQLIVYTRGEIFDTHLTTAGILDNPDYEHHEYTVGLVYKPFKSFEIEADYQLLRSRGDKNSGQLNLGLAYFF